MTDFDKLTNMEIANWRLRNQRLVGDRWNDPVEVVRGLLCVQAENFSQSGWALATRCDPAPTEQNVHDLFDAGRILRTHVIRPTWHYALPDDIVWLTELTGPRVHKSFIRSQQISEGITDLQRDQMVDCAVGAIETDGPLTRDQVRERLADAGLPTSGAALILTMGMAETSALVCSGPRRDGAQTYALMSERAPNARRLDPDDALAELTMRYVAGHGPVTEHDLSYWATQTLTTVRKGLVAISEAITSFEHNGLTYWHLRDDEPPSTVQPSAHILQILDEMYRGYHKDSRLVLDSANIVPHGRETSIGMVLADTQFVASMNRRLTDSEVEFALGPYRPLADEELTALCEVADAYGRYCGRSATVTID